MSSSPTRLDPLLPIPVVPCHEQERVSGVRSRARDPQHRTPNSKPPPNRLNQALPDVIRTPPRFHPLLPVAIVPCREQDQVRSVRSRADRAGEKETSISSPFKETCSCHFAATGAFLPGFPGDFWRVSRVRINVGTISEVIGD
jgi:hypothetical protein